MTDEGKNAEPQTPGSQETTANDSWLAPSLESVWNQYGPSQARGLLVLVALGSAFALGFLAGMGRPVLDPVWQWVGILAMTVFLVLSLTQLRASKKREAEGVDADVEQVAAATIGPADVADIDADSPGDLAQADTVAEETCTHPGNHDFPNLRANTKCRRCGKTAGKVVMAYVKGGR